MIEVDGSSGEGGGQIVRTSLTLAALTGQPVRLSQIRANRSKPGLQPQHLAAVKAIAAISQAEYTGAALNSTELTLIPAGLRAGRYQFDIATAGALTLVLQTVFLPLSFAAGSSSITLTGGTHVPWSPSFDYLQTHWLPMMADIGFRNQATLQKAGFYPAGGGEVIAKILPSNDLNPYRCLDRGTLVRIRGLSGAANLDEAIIKRQKHQALKRLYPACRDSKIKSVRLPGRGKGSFILLRAEFSNCGSACFSALGAPGKPAERVADEAVDQILAFLETRASVDRFLADQLLLPLSVIEGESQFQTERITPHLLTQAEVIRQFLPVEITISGALNQPGSVFIRGCPLPHQ